MLEKINPEESSRALAYQYLNNQVLPTVTLIKRIDVTKIKKISKKTGHKFNCIINYLILKSAMNIPEFFLKIDGTDNGLFKSDKICLSFMSKKKNGFLAYCGVEYAEDFLTFEKQYNLAVKYCYENNCDKFIEDSARIGTSTVPWTNLVGIINGYGPNFTNPFITLPKIEKKFFRYYINISFQSHHLQMDGEQACKYLENLEKNVKSFKI